jgi:Endonuclease/Exonuclease/phosphatase family.
MPKFSKFFKGLGIVVLIILILLVCAVLWLTIREYRPEKEEALKVPKNTRTLSLDDSLRIITYNIGYAGLDKSEDFFMDGGSEVQPDSKEQVETNLTGIKKVLTENPADVYFLQEVDKDSKRSFHIDETEYLKSSLNMEGIFAYNFKCDFVPYPLPPIEKVNSGIFTMTDLKVNSAARLALPESFSWPVKTCNLKRCMQETRIPLEGTDAELVLINFHLEAYDDGDGKIAQSKMLAEKLSKEYEAGNYVIAGGDFNQTFEGMDKYPITNTENWIPGVISQDTLPEHFPLQLMILIQPADF